jgi:hypothetical protein
VETNLDQQSTVPVMQVGMAKPMEKPTDSTPKILLAYCRELPFLIIHNVMEILGWSAMHLHGLFDALELLPNLNVMIQFQRFCRDPVMPTHAHAEDGNKYCLESVEDGSVEEGKVHFREHRLLCNVEASVVRMKKPNK